MVAGTAAAVSQNPAYRPARPPPPLTCTNARSRGC